MHKGSYIFSQLIELVSPKRFQTIVNRDSVKYKGKDFFTRNSFDVWL